MQLTITNLASTATYIRDLYITLDASAAVTVERSAGEIDDMVGLKELQAAGTVSVAVVESTTEQASSVSETVSAALPLVLPSYDDAGRPDPAAVTAGTAIWNTDDGAPNFSDGTNWVDAAGVTT